MRLRITQSCVIASGYVLQSRPAMASQTTPCDSLFRLRIKKGKLSLILIASFGKDTARGYHAAPRHSVVGRLVPIRATLYPPAFYRVLIFYLVDTQRSPRTVI